MDLPAGAPGKGQLYIDGKLVAAAEEERFLRDKHAKNRMPFEAAKFCLAFAGIKPADVVNLEPGSVGFPESVIDMMSGGLGWPPGGFPQEVMRVVLGEKKFKEAKTKGDIVDFYNQIWE